MAILQNNFLAGVMVGAIAGGLISAVIVSGMPQSNGASASAEARSAPMRGGPGGRRGGYRAPPTSLAPAEAARVSVAFDAIGVVRAQRSLEISTEVAGIVEAVAFQPGQYVEAGDELLRIQDREQVIALQRARAQYPIAKRNAERFAALAKEDAASALEAENAFNQVKALEADLRAAEFALSRRTITAAFDGRVGLTEIEPGNLVAAGQLVTTLDATDTVVVVFDIPQEVAQDIVIGGLATVTDLRGGVSAEGKVTAIDTRVDAASRTLNVEATFDNPDNFLRPGATVTVSTQNEGATGVRVPGLAVQWDRTGSFVWRRGPEGSAVRAGVEILQRTASDAIVRGSLAPGDLIVVEGADRVRPGMPLSQRGADDGGAAFSVSGQ